MQHPCQRELGKTNSCPHPPQNVLIFLNVYKACLNKLDDTTPIINTVVIKTLECLHCPLHNQVRVPHNSQSRAHGNREWLMRWGLESKRFILMQHPRGRKHWQQAPLDQLWMSYYIGFDRENGVSQIYHHATEHTEINTPVTLKQKFFYSLCD